MKTTLNVYQFRDAFKHAGRGEQFSYDALGLLFEYYEALEDDTGEEIELDVIAICCEWSESDWKTIALDYQIDLSGCVDDDRKGEVFEFLTLKTTAIEVGDDGVFLFISF